MFRRHQEYLDYTVYPSEEGVDLLAIEACKRIERVGGQDYLDGYNIPPKNDEPYDPKPYQMHITTFYWRGEECVGATEETRTVVPDISNASIRTSDIKLIAQGREPLFRTWEEIAEDRRRKQPEKDAIKAAIAHKKAAEFAQTRRGKILKTIGLAQQAA
jgi:hypothetical protein